MPEISSQGELIESHGAQEGLGVGAIRNELSRLTVRATSESEDIVAVLTSRGIAIKFGPHIFEDYKEEDLEQEIEVLLTDLLEAYAGQVKQLSEQTYGATPEPAPNTKAARRQEEIEERRAEIAAEATSPKRYVSIIWKWRRDFMVVLTENAFSKLDHSGFTREVNSALAEVTVKYNAEVRRAFNQLNRIDSISGRGVDYE